MVKYVSKDIICAKMMHCNFRSPDMTVSDFINDELPAADVQPVKRGEWGERAYGRLQCSYCGKCEDIATNFCPNCGARMDGDTECQ